MFDTMLAGDIKQTLEDFRRSVDQLFSDVYRPGTSTTIEASADIDITGNT